MKLQAGDCPGLCFASFLHALAGLNQAHRHFRWKLSRSRGRVFFAFLKALDLRWSPVLDFFQEMCNVCSLWCVFCVCRGDVSRCLQENDCGTRPPKRQAKPQSVPASIEFVSTSSLRRGSFTLKSKQTGPWVSAQITSVAVLQHAYENALRRPVYPG